MKKTIAIIGPESTGKSALAAALAKAWNAQWLPEYARTYLEALEQPYDYQDLIKMAKTQHQQEQQLRALHDKVILDTNLEVFKVWSEYKYNSCDHWILYQIAQQDYDAYLVTDIDLPWTPDPLREHPDITDRIKLLNIYKDIAIHSNIPFAVINGSGEKRLENAIEFMKSMALW